MVITQRVAELHNKYVVKQSREVPGKQRRSLSAGERQALEKLQSNWQSRQVTSQTYNDEFLGRSQWEKTASLRGDQLVSTPEGVRSESQVYPQSTNPTFSTISKGASQITPTTSRVGGGLYYLKPNEAKGYKGRKPTWAVESKTPHGAIREAQWSSSVKPSTTNFGYGTTRGQFEYNVGRTYEAKQGFRAERQATTDIRREQSIFAKDPERFEKREGVIKTKTPMGYSYSLTEDYYKNVPSYQKYKSMFDDKGLFVSSGKGKAYAKQKFKQLPKGERVKATMGEYQVGALRMGVGFGEGIATYSTMLGTQTLKKDSKVGWAGFKTKPVTFPKTQIIKNAPTTPSSYNFLKNPVKWSKETVLTRPAATIPVIAAGGLIAGGGYMVIKNIKKLGFGRGFGETISYTSPLKLNVGRRYMDVSKELVKDSGAMQAEIIYNKGKSAMHFTDARTYPSNVRVRNVQFQGVDKGKTGGVSLTSADVPYIDYTGGVWKQGTSNLKTVSAFEGKPTGKFGFEGKSIVADIAAGQVYKRNIAGVKAYSPLTKGSKTKVYGFMGGEQIKVLSPIGKRSKIGFMSYGRKPFQFTQGFKPEVKGYGISWDISKTPKSGGVKVFGGGGTKTTLAKTFSPISSQIQLPKIKGISKGSSYVKVSTKSPSIIQRASTKTRTVVSTKSALGLKSMTRTNSIFGAGGKSFVSPTSRPIFKTSPTTRVTPAFSTAQFQQPKFSTKLMTSFKGFSGGGTSPIGTSFNPPRGFGSGFPIGGFFIGGGLTASGTKKFRATPKYRYTPSYSALVFGIKGKKPSKKFYTGFEMRPITTKKWWKNK